MAQKLTFSARKDPLLRRPRAADEDDEGGSPADAMGATGGTKPSRPPARKRTARASRSPRPSLAAVEEPAGVIAVPTESGRSARPDEAGRAPNDRGASDPSPSAEHRERSVRSARRVQTSMSFPPTTWDTLDELGEATSVSAGELLIAILSEAIPDTPAAALAAIEQLLISAAHDDGPHEERNYRLPIDLRTQLDALTKALGPPVQRSLLIRALLAAHLPQSSDAARELITKHRIRVMRAAVGTLTAD